MCSSDLRERPEAEEDFTIRDFCSPPPPEVLGDDLTRGEGGSGWRLRREAGLGRQGREAGPCSPLLPRESCCIPLRKVAASASSREMENLGRWPDSPLPLLLLASWGLDDSLELSVVEKEARAPSPTVAGILRPAPATMATPATPEDMNSADIWGDDNEELDEEIMAMSSDDIRQRTRHIEEEIRYMNSEIKRIQHESASQKEKIKENNEKIKLNKQLPFLVGNIVEVLDLGAESDEEEDGAAQDADAGRKTKSVVVRTSTRQTIYLPIPGLVDVETLEPGDLVGTNKDSYLILEKLPSEFDSRVKAMEVDEKPTEQFNDVGGLEDQIQELIEAIVLPMTHKERFANLGIKPPKGALMYGPPGTGKTLIARACAAQTNACFLKLAGPQLVQMFIGDGAKDRKRHV